MNGGRKKWELEGRPLTTEVPKFSATHYSAGSPDDSVRARREQIFTILEKKNAYLVDVRSPDEFTGKVIAPPGMTETAQRGGHIPSAVNVPWSKAANDDGTFKSYEELVKLYEGQGVRPDREAVAFCRIGERSSHTWRRARSSRSTPDNMPKGRCGAAPAMDGTGAAKTRLLRHALDLT
jgi:thiosulfate/3-mercaptopyruvate sulfurtransferase